MPRQKLWTFEAANIDLEDLDVSVTAIHGPSLAQICIRFRIREAELKGDVGELRRRLEYLASEKILDLASFLDAFGY